MLPDPEDDRSLYVMLFTNQDAYDQVLQATDGIIEYSYTNATDAQALELGDDGWRERGETWRRILPTGVPADSGLSWRLPAGAMRVDLRQDAEELLQLAPTLKQRARGRPSSRSRS
ncbi:hypothetical protein [Ornithinicoccus halotolerans]|uniref:hypothetical protein n=1 Tax=Ornithinicoccus halotolerans TaxID=1748220 RepID=UPI0012977176|nr:hypothetical protein [Ornithinicoccus halotolerans]